MAGRKVKIKHLQGKKSFRKPKKSMKNSSRPTKNNLSFIQRGKEMVESHRRQKSIDEKYFPKRTQSDIIGVNEETLENAQKAKNNEMNDGAAFDKLVASLAEHNKLQAEVTTEEEEVETDDESDDAEEQSPAGPVKADLSSDEAATQAADNEDEPMDEDKSKGGPVNIFKEHLEYNMPNEIAEIMLDKTKTKTADTMLNWPRFREFLIKSPLSNEKELIADAIVKEPITFVSVDDLLFHHVRKSLAERVTLPFTQLQNELFTLFNTYQDVYFTDRSHGNPDELRDMYCLHVLNHMMKVRDRVVKNNRKIAESGGNLTLACDLYRDQGLVRPRILILLPFREDAYQVVTKFCEYYTKQAAGNDKVVNYKRFLDEYGGGNTLRFPKTNPKPADYEATFAGNTDDNFRLGVTLTKNSIKLYTDFIASDIIIASPLALKSSQDKHHDYLNSIELMIIDKVDVLYAQNLENLHYVFDHLHGAPSSMETTDFVRVRNWNINGYAPFYRQTLIFASQDMPEFRSLINSECRNYRGKAVICHASDIEDMRNVIVPVVQRFRRFDVTDPASMADQRFDYFVKNVLPNFSGPSYAHCLIYIPSYFDFVRVRNYFKETTKSFVQICEYSDDAKISRARDLFFHSGVQFMLYSERAHFYRRFRIKGIRHLIMYQPPTWSKFYSEIVNFMQPTYQNPNDYLESSMSVTVLYTKFDRLRMNGIVGRAKTDLLIRHHKDIRDFTVT